MRERERDMYTNRDIQKEVYVCVKVCGLMVIIIENQLSESSSNCRKDGLCLTFC